MSLRGIHKHHDKVVKFIGWRNHMRPRGSGSHIPVPTELSPAELEERVRAAQFHDQKLRQAVASMEEAMRAIVGGCAKSVGKPGEKDISRLIWHGIVQYANADLSDGTGLGEAFLAFQAFTTLCLVRERNPMDTIVVSDLPFGDLEELTQGRTLETFEEFFDACCGQLSRLHPQFRTMLSWLADPRAAAQGNQATEILSEHAGNGAIELDLSPNDDFDDTGKRGAPFFYWKTVRRYRTILSPVSKFILDRIERYHADEKRDRLTLSEAIPLFMCKRPTCRRFAVLRRTTRNFCSASCRTLYRQESRPEEHAAYQRKYRQLYKKP